MATLIVYPPRIPSICDRTHFAFCADPRSLSRKGTVDLLYSFLIHVPPHLAAASKLLLGDPVTDVFGVGAVLGDGKPTA